LSSQVQKIQRNQQIIDQKITSEFSNQSPEAIAKIEIQQAAIAALQFEIEQIKAVQEQHTAMLEEIRAQLLDRQK
jgi:hypothetical protein